ncbi:prephenate dehydratase [Diaporthe helianthi]|uniref:prephenate dehydratase n=1 Tax=Diaporthe helianthi TaxID=158607 RepID=A0A2P5IBE3_DIAHE|nr:prephenate dehydratase [Diaporthe helianthi]
MSQKEGETPSTKPLVAFLGPPSSFTHQATKSAFSEDAHTLNPVATIKDVFDAVAAGTADYGVVPFENSTHGVVTFTLGHLADRGGEYRELSVCGEVYIDVHHFLLGRAPRDDNGPPAAAAAESSSSSYSSSASQQKGKPQHDLSHVRRVYSHPQAFGQTQAFLSAHLPSAETIDVSSTSKAAEMAGLDASGETAAISNESAAAAFGLDVLARRIEDRDDNTTRFFVLRRAGGGAGAGAGGDVGEEEEEEVAGGATTKNLQAGAHKSLVSFTVPHRSPGALAAVLDVFRKVGLNLTSINSLPSLIQPFQYLFLVEFDGSRYHDPEGKVEAALAEVAKVAESSRWLGSWENRR